MSKFSAVSTCSSLLSKLHLVNGAQFFKANLIRFNAGTAGGLPTAAPDIALILPSTKIYASA